MTDGLHFSVFLLPLVAFTLHGCFVGEDTIKKPKMCPYQVGTETDGICLVMDPATHQGACYNSSSRAAPVTCILTVLDYDSFTCPTGSPDKCKFLSAIHNQ